MNLTKLTYKELTRLAKDDNVDEFVDALESGAVEAFEPSSRRRPKTVLEVLARDGAENCILAYFSSGRAPTDDEIDYFLVKSVSHGMVRSFVQMYRSFKDAKIPYRTSEDQYAESEATAADKIFRGAVEKLNEAPCQSEYSALCDDALFLHSRFIRRQTSEYNLRRYFVNVVESLLLYRYSEHSQNHVKKLLAEVRALDRRILLTPHHLNRLLLAIGDYQNIEDFAEILVDSESKSVLKKLAKSRLSSDRGEPAKFMHTAFREAVFINRYLDKDFVSSKSFDDLRIKLSLNRLKPGASRSLMTLYLQEQPSASAEDYAKFAETIDISFVDMFIQNQISLRELQQLSVSTKTTKRRL